MQLKEGEQLPPTSSAFFQHILRALLQTFEWKSATRAIVEKLNIFDYGWYKEGELFLPVPMVYDALPTSLKEFVSCKCKGRCEMRRCSCKRMYPPTACTELCRCSENCENTDPDYVMGDESESDDDDND